ncbi:hypothetical protein [Neptuniibacter sp. UBA847]|uniref:hypothetical protein n=1 Tax=Neptuniibacter sp. UBA847 TaxID=1946977 RepID=UPI0025F88D56|nr:hypothetical protein [Neptuniibacter sp. UBA847]
MKHMHADRVEALEQILSFGQKREEAYAVLLCLVEDAQSELVVVSNRLLSDVLKKYLDDVISSDDLEEWANFIECREDVDYSEIEDYVYALSNPELMGNIDKDKVVTMLKLLNEK